MDPIILYVIISLGFVLLLLQWMKLAELSRKSTDLRPILDTLHILQSDRGLLDRGMRDENSRNRQEQANESQALRSEVVATLIAVGDSVAAKVGGVSQSNDQRAELLRFALEQRMDSFASESARKIDGLTQSLECFIGIAAGRGIGKIERLQEFARSHRERGESASAGRKRRVFPEPFGPCSPVLEQRQIQQQTCNRRQARELLGQSVLSTLTGISQLQKAEMQDLKATVDSRLSTIQFENEKKLDQMRQTVDEKLQGTLEARLGESFRQVSERLEQVYSGLGEMKTLASGVGDLKRVLTNVKTRGTWGEVQLGAIIEQILAPEQFAEMWPRRAAVSALSMPSSCPAATVAASQSGFPSTRSFPMEDYLHSDGSV